MFTTPKKKPQNSEDTSSSSKNGPATMVTEQTADEPAIVLENGTLLGALTETNPRIPTKNLIIPEIIISASYSSNSLNRSRCDIGSQVVHQTSVNNCEDTVAESTALLDAQSDADMPQDDFEQFILNRTTSDSNILDSSIYSELQFSPSINGDGGVTIVEDNNSNGGSTAAQIPAPQQASSGNNANVVDMLNSSTCSRESRQNKRTRRKHKSKSKCSVVSNSGQRAASVLGATYPPQYTAIFLDPHHHHHLSGAANAMGQIASAAASSPFLNAPVVGAADANFLHQQYQLYQQRPFLGSLSALGHHHHHRPLLDVAIPNHNNASADGGNPTNIANNVTTPTSSTINPPIRPNFRKWFSRPSLPFVIGILALGGVACTLGGIVLGSTGLIEHSTQYLSAALLMIGIGVSLLVISGAIWRLSLPDDVDECPCYRHMETCRNCNSPYCNNRLLPGSYLYPEFQHRPPPPSYLTSLNECAAMGLLFHPAAQPQQAFTALRMNTPPPLYRSTNSLSVYVPNSNTTTTMATTATSPNMSNTISLPVTNSGSILPDHNALTMSVVMENLQAQTQALTKEINYLELD